MGDMSDWLLSSQDPYGWDDPDGYHDQLAGDRHRRKLNRGLHTCRYCGVSGLRWMHTENGWRLASTAFVHVCSQHNINVTEGFEK